MSEVTRWSRGGHEVRALFSTAALVSGGTLKFKDADLSLNNTVPKDRKASAAEVSFKGGVGGVGLLSELPF
jgi:hypothetical protein